MIRICRSITTTVTLLPTLLLFAGCAVTTPSPQWQVSTGNAPGIEQVRANTKANQNKSVLWGGTIANMETRDGRTWIEVIARPLYLNGQPNTSQASEGRFIAIFDKLLDPAEIRRGSSISVVGVVSGTIRGKIDEMDYEFPLVQTNGHHIWPDDNRRYAYRFNLIYNPAAPS